MNENLQYRLAHPGITVRNLEESMNWYETNFGFIRGEVKDRPKLGLRLVHMKLDESEIELVCPYSPSERKPDSAEDLAGLLGVIGLNHIALSVDDVSRSYNALKEKGVEFVGELMESRFFFCRDSANDVLIEIRQR